MDAYEEAGKATKLPKDGAEAAALDKKKADGEEVEEKGDPRELKADRKADAFADSDARRDALSAIQSDAQRASNAWGENARGRPGPTSGRRSICASRAAAQNTFGCMGEC
jgi:hypothetical protein